jgi:hypothetical protein
MSHELVLAYSIGFLGGLAVFPLWLALGWVASKWIDRDDE